MSVYNSWNIKNSQPNLFAVFSPMEKKDLNINLEHINIKYISDYVLVKNMQQNKLCCLYLL